MIATTGRASHPAPMLAVVLTTCQFIPPITDPMGRSWRQPNMMDVEFDDTHALLTKAQFDGLAEYSTTTPTGVYPGKCWKVAGRERTTTGFRLTGIWYLRWFGYCEDPNMCSNNQREIIIIN